MTVRLFDYNHSLAGHFAEVEHRIKAEIDREAESYVRDANTDQWAEHLAEKYSLDPPVVVEDKIQIEDLGERQVDATNMPGVTYSLTEWGNVIRPGREIRLVVPVQGDAQLLRHGPSSGTPIVEATIEGSYVFRRWEWPIARGNDELNREIQEVIGAVTHGAVRVAAEIAERNAALANFAKQAIAKRRAELETHREFLAGLTVPVKRREDAPKPFTLPPIEPRKPQNPLVPKPEPVTGPALVQLYDEILGVIRPWGRAMERVPDDFAGLEEERLRDHLLVALNTQYRGQAGAEAFNKSGKTDLLLRVQDHNAFIGECKWWSGPKGMDDALHQLYSYSTWRDSRLALIFFVPTKDPAAVVEKARSLLGGRPEFDGSDSGAAEGELRCRIRWPDDLGRNATLTVLFFHLPR